MYQLDGEGRTVSKQHVVGSDQFKRPKMLTARFIHTRSIYDESTIMYLTPENWKRYSEPHFTGNEFS